MRKRPTHAELVDDFLRSKQREDFARPATISWYRSQLNGLARAGWDPSRFVTEANTVSTARSRRRAVRVFYAWAKRTHGLKNPAKKLKSPQGKARLPRVLTTQELHAIHREAQLDPVNAAMFAVLLDTGIRIGELASLTTDRITPAGLDVAGKTGERTVPLSPEARRALMRITSPSGPVFRWEGRPTSTAGLKTRWRRLLQRAGVSGRKLGPHTMRHTFATLYLVAGGDLKRLSLLLGHSTISTTAIYLTLAQRDVWQEHGRLSPLKTLNLAQEGLPEWTLPAISR